MLNKPQRLIYLLIAGALVSACGGGGSSSSKDNAVTASCSGEFCGATKSSYQGNGVGVWHYTNKGNDEVKVPVHLSGLANKTVMLVYTNTTPAPIRMPVISSFVAPKASIKALKKSSPQRYNNIPDNVRNFDSTSLIKELRDGSDKNTAVATPALKSSVKAKYALGSSRNWTISGPKGFENRTATLRRHAGTADGRTINLWLENGEHGTDKITETMLDELILRLAGAGNSVYYTVTGVAGQPWGPHTHLNLMAENQALNVVFVNFDNDKQPMGLLGYFHSLNNFKHDPNHPELKHSNEALAFFMDTETIYLSQDQNEGLRHQLNTLAHEFTHMINFYQRDISIGEDYAFDTFLDEMTAVMMEDLTAQNITPGFNSLRDSYMHEWVANSKGFNCNLTEWDDVSEDCFGYPRQAAFGGYMLRHFGLDFYKDLLRNRISTDSVAVLENAISNAGGGSLAQTLQRFADSSIALLPGQTSPVAFGYPQRTFNNRQSHHVFTLPFIEGTNYLIDRRLPTALPLYLNGYANFPFMRLIGSEGVLKDSYPVPAGVTLSVVVH